MLWRSVRVLTARAPAGVASRRPNRCLRGPAVIIDCAHYKDGRRQHEEPLSLEEAATRCTTADGGFVWVGVHDPTDRELSAIAGQFSLHELAVEDATHAHQRPKLEDYGDGDFFVVLRTAHYHDDVEEIEFGEVHLFIGPAYVVSVRHGAGSPLHEARLRLEARPELVELGPASVVWAIVDKVVDDYEPVVAGLEDDIEEVEVGVFGGSGHPTQRIYFLRREVIEFYRAVHPLVAPLESLETGFVTLPPMLQQFFRDVADHVRRVNETVMQQRELLSSVLQANLAVVTVEQNDVVRKVSGWAAIITVSTLIASIYGMNFDHMPELHWRVGYPMALALMLLAAFGLWRTFKRTGWL
jgi:magnesium transporter